MSIIRTIKRLWSKEISGSVRIDWMRSEDAELVKEQKFLLDQVLCFVDTTRPWLIDIGENVQITGGENLNAWFMIGQS
ncbi:MAG: hypothetical protein ACLU6Y_14600 [Ruminococcus sp.]